MYFFGRHGSHAFGLLFPHMISRMASIFQPEVWGSDWLGKAAFSSPYKIQELIEEVPIK
jgi:hypothetical protein